MRIIIGVDGSPQALVGVRWVAHLPLSSHDDVLLVSVVETPATLGAWGFGAWGCTDSDTNRRAIDGARTAMAQATPRINAITLSELRDLPCPVHTVELRGSPVETLEECAARCLADLLVVGPHGHGRLGTMLLGSVSQSLLRAMPTSILVARGPLGAPRRVLLATDGSRAGLAAAAFVAESAITREATIDVLALPEHGPVRPAAEEVHDRAIDDVFGLLDATGRTDVRRLGQGDPKHAILALAEERRSDLIVMGTRGAARGFRASVQGSVSCAVSRAATCSTLAVAQPRAMITDTRPVASAPAAYPLS